MDLQQLTLSVCKVAREAGAYIKKERASFSLDKVERKHAHDYVSYVDKGSEQFIVKALRELLPEAGFITEEGTTIATPHSDQRSEKDDVRCQMADGRCQKDDVSDVRHHTSDFIWVVDPLDGTTNFIHGFAPYAVSIALCKGCEIVVGVVYEIVSDECFYAWKGGKAWVNDQSLHVGTSAINDALLCLQLPYNSDAYKPVIKRLIDHFYGHVGSIRMMGSAAIALCYVAAGRLDAYAERYIGQWDYMAGALIVKEAGGCVTNYAGEEYFMEGDSVVATNGVIHQELLEAVKQAEDNHPSA